MLLPLGPISLRERLDLLDGYRIAATQADVDAGVAEAEGVAVADNGDEVAFLVSGEEFGLRLFDGGKIGRRSRPPSVVA